MSYVITNKEIKEYVNDFIRTNNLKDYSAESLILYTYQILYRGYVAHGWKYNNFAVYTLARLCFKQFNSSVLDLEEIFYHYLKTGMKSNVMINLSAINYLDFENHIRNSIENYMSVIMRSIYNLEIIILSEYRYDCMIENFDTYRICGRLGNEMTKYFYIDFIKREFTMIVKYIKSVMQLYYKLYKEISKIKEYYLFSCAGKEEREIGLIYGKCDMLLISNDIFNKINYLDFFTDFKMQDDGTIRIVNNQSFYKRWCNLSEFGLKIG